LEYLWERDSLENLGVGGKMLLKWIFMKWLEAWIGFFWLRIEADRGLY